MMKLLNYFTPKFISPLIPLLLIPTACDRQNTNADSSVVTTDSADSRLELVVDSKKAIKSAIDKAKPGETIILKNGTYRDLSLILKGNGRSGAPIEIKGETLGKVILTGSSSISMRGDHLRISNLVFKNGTTPNKEVVAIGDENTPCNNCSVSKIKIEKYSPKNQEEKNYWVSFTGKNSELSKSTFIGKSNFGPMIAVLRNDNDANHHVIRDNEFLDQPKGSHNGFEVIRIGTGVNADSNSFTTIENNLFENCSGETETISNKSGGNTIRFNTFRGNNGGLTLRNGHGATVEGNYFLGLGVPGSYGIRITGKNNTVVGNHIEGVNSDFFHGITLIAGYKATNLDNEATYNNAENNFIGFNTVINASQGGILIGGSRGGASRTGPSTPPKNNKIANNVVKLNDTLKAVTAELSAPDSVTLIDNSFDSADPGSFAGVARVSLATAPRGGVTAPNPIDLVRISSATLRTHGASSKDLKLLESTIYERYTPLIRGQVGARATTVATSVVAGISKPPAAPAPSSAAVSPPPANLPPSTSSPAAPNAAPAASNAPKCEVFSRSPVNDGNGLCGESCRAQLRNAGQSIGISDSPGNLDNRDVSKAFYLKIREKGAAMGCDPLRGTNYN